MTPDGRAPMRNRPGALAPARLQLNEPEDDVAIVLAWLAHSGQPVNDDRIDVDEGHWPR
jgi:hypothetical protein